MDRIQYSEAEQIEREPSLPDDKPVFSAQTKTPAGDVQEWVGKPSIWAGGRHSLRLGMEMFYYAMAAHNKLPMPDSGILSFNDLCLPKWGGKMEERKCWGTKFMVGGTLGTKDDQLPCEVLRKVETTFRNDRDQREAYVRAVFLDVMLCNCDRTVSNILKINNGETLSLFYFDHEQSLGWRNNIEMPDRNRIQSPEDQYADVHENIRLECDYGWAATHSTLDERKRIFEGIELRVSMLDEVRQQMLDYGVGYWVHPEQVEDIKKGLDAWWRFLRDKPYEELDRRLFPARLPHGTGRLFGG